MLPFFLTCGLPTNKEVWAGTVVHNWHFKGWNNVS